MPLVVHQKSHYLEAFDGAKFSVVITLTQDFSLHGLADSECVTIESYFDGRLGHRKAWERSTIESNRRSRILVQVRETHIEEYCPETRQWYKGVLTFSPLRIR